MTDRKQKVEAFSIDLDTIGIENNIIEDDISRYSGSQKRFVFSLNQIYSLWELIEKRIPRKEIYIMKESLNLLTKCTKWNYEDKSCLTERSEDHYCCQGCKNQNLINGHLKKCICTPARYKPDECPICGPYAGSEF